MALPPSPQPDPTTEHLGPKSETGGSTRDLDQTQDHDATAKHPSRHDYLSSLQSAFGDRYALELQLGAGGFGTVFRALDQRLNRRVALKISQSGADHDQLLREARALAQLRHEGIVAVHDVAVVEGYCFIVSELLAGPSLSEWLETKRPPAVDAVRIVAAVADALAHAHARSIIHRDVKPSNIVFAEGQRPVLVDFGLALSDMDSAVERGVVSGTPAYMSPEQAAGKAHRPDGRTDIYGLAATLYAMLCGRAPFRGKDISEVLQQVREDDPQPPRQLCPDLPVELERVCLKGLSKLPGDRYTTAADFAVALRRSVGLLSQHPVPEPVPPAPPRAKASAPVASPPAPVARRGPRTERRQITLLQCSCESRGADDDDPMEHVSAFQAICAEVIAAHGGFPLQASGSAFLACFGYPVAHEDAPRQAVRAAMTIGLRSGVAVAVVTGLAVITEQSPAAPVVVGDVIAVTSALLAQGTPGGVTIADGTFHMVKGYFDCEPDGEVRLRGIAAAVPVYRVAAEREVRSRLEAVDPTRLSVLVGRDREVALLRERWELAAEGVRNVILLVADPVLGRTTSTGPTNSAENRTPSGGSISSSRNSARTACTIRKTWRCSRPCSRSPPGNGYRSWPSAPTDKRNERCTRSSAGSLRGPSTPPSCS